MLLQYYVFRVLCCYVTMLLQYYVFRVLCCYVTMLLQCYVIRVLCCYITMLLQCYVIRVLCCCVIMLSGYYTIAISQQSLFHIHTDYQYITVLIKQRIQLYYNNLHTIIWYRLICNICKSGCHSSIQCRKRSIPTHSERLNPPTIIAKLALKSAWKNGVYPFISAKNATKRHKKRSISVQWFGYYDRISVFSTEIGVYPFTNENVIIL